MVDRVPTALLIRHGRTTANTAGILAGRSPGVLLDDTGQAQAATLAERLSDLPLRRIVASPLERTLATAQALASVPGPRRAPRPQVATDDGLLECDYGAWTNRKISDLAREPMWKTVQSHPSAAVFPDGEWLADVQARAVHSVREHDRAVAGEHGPNAVWALVSHGDVIKAILADALGTHLDTFQRIVVDTCSVSVIRYTELRPFVVTMNGNGTDLGKLAPTRRRAKPSSDAVVGGGPG